MPQQPFDIYRSRTLDQFTNAPGSIAPAKLDGEVRAKQLSVGFHGIVAINNVVYFGFGAEPTPDDDNKLQEVVAAHDGVKGAEEPTPTDPRTGFPVVQLGAWAWSEEDSVHHGEQFQAARDIITFHDIEITTEVYVQEAEYVVKDAVWGDRVEFSVVDKNGVIPHPSIPNVSLMEAYGLTPGVDVLELKKYERNLAVEPGVSRGKIESRTAAQMLPGLFARVAYNAMPKPVDQQDIPDLISVNLLFHFYEE